MQRRGGRKRAIGTRAPLEKAARPNAIWVLDFVSDSLETGRRFRVFNVEDQFTRRGLASILIETLHERTRRENQSSTTAR